MSTLEKEIEGYLRAQVELRGGRCLKWVSPGNSGVPDRIVLLPQGRIGFAELKRPKGSTTEEIQKYWQRTLKDLGFTAAILKDKKDVAQFLNEMAGGIDMRKAVKTYAEKMDRL